MEWNRTGASCSPVGGKGFAIGLAVSNDNDKACIEY